MDNNLRKIRKSRNISLRDLGDRVGIGYTALSKAETGKRNLNDEDIHKLCEFFNVSADTLLGIYINEPKIQFALHGLEDDLSKDEKEMIVNIAKNLVDMKKKGSK